jgi:hypothetical protein
MYFLLFVLGFAATIAILSKLIIIYAEKVITILVEKKHKDAEAILSTGTVPPRWIKLGIASYMGGDILKLIAIRRLDKIIKYFKHSPMVESDNARQILIERLQSIQDSWCKMEWKKMYPYE